MYSQYPHPLLVRLPVQRVSPFSVIFQQSDRNGAVNQFSVRFWSDLYAPFLVSFQSVRYLNLFSVSLYSQRYSSVSF